MRGKQLVTAAVAAGVGAVSALLVGGGMLAAFAQDGKKFDMLDLVTDRAPKVKVNADDVNFERLVTRRVDLVDEKGVIRMTLAAELPNPVMDGIEYKRNAPVSGIMIRDDKGNERGGMGFHTSGHVLLVLDHVNGEAVGLGALEDGSTEVFLGGRGEIVRDPRLGGRIVPVPGSAGELRISIDKKGGQALNMTDRQGRTRLTLHITEEGHGEIRFLDADGKVVGRYGPGSK